MLESTSMKKKMSEKELSFEEMIEQLEKIANELEKGDLDLDQSVQKFEQGMQLSKECNQLLEKAEKRITILLQDGDKIKEENFIQEEE